MTVLGEIVHLCGYLLPLSFFVGLALNNSVFGVYYGVCGVLSLYCRRTLLSIRANKWLYIFFAQAIVVSFVSFAIGCVAFIPRRTLLSFIPASVLNPLRDIFSLSAAPRRRSHPAGPTPSSAASSPTRSSSASRSLKSASPASPPTAAASSSTARPTSSSSSSSCRPPSSPSPAPPPSPSPS